MIQVRYPKMDTVRHISLSKDFRSRDLSEQGLGLGGFLTSWCQIGSGTTYLTAIHIDHRSKVIYRLCQ